jgi:hypothetical protein
MTNLFPLPYWAPALQRVPKPLQRLDEAFALGERAPKGAPRHDRKRHGHFLCATASLLERVFYYALPLRF